jgi:hypothetical protein
VADDIEVHYDPSRGNLFLACGAEAFARLRDSVIAEARVPEVVNGSLDAVRLIEVTMVPAYTPSRFRDRAALLGCGLVGFVVLFPFVVGVTTIIGWWL